jgi:hypothetical protein
MVGGVQAYNQGMAESDAAATNAKIAGDNAARARLDAAAAEEAHRREARKALGRSAAAASQSGAAGSGPGQGSIGLVLGQSAKEAELDALNIRYGGETEAGASLTEQSMFLAEKRAAVQRAKGGLMSGVLGAASAGLSGFADYRVGAATRRARTYAPARSARAATATKAPRIDAYRSGYKG